MSTPEFITNLRTKIGNDPLWLTGITAYVEDAQGRILLGKRADEEIEIELPGGRRRLAVVEIRYPENPG